MEFEGMQVALTILENQHFLGKRVLYLDMSINSNMTVVFRLLKNI